MNTNLKPLIIAVAVAVQAPTSLSQNILEEVLVTATKKTESLQDIAVTVTAFSDKTIQEAGIYDAVDVSVLTPSLSVNVNTNPFNARFSIRGIGTAQNDFALEPSVGVFVDDVYLSRTGFGMSDLTDIQRIEVLQGPQGTLYGKNTNAGAISVVTKAPNLEEFEGQVEVSAGNYGLTRVNASVSGPLSETVAFRLAGMINQRDGYLDNSFGDDLNDADDWVLRGKLLWEPTENLAVTLSGNHVERDNTCCGADATQTPIVNAVAGAQGLPLDAGDPYDYKVGVDQPNSFELESDLVSLHAVYDREWGSVTSITAWNEYDYVVSDDSDRSVLDVLPTIDNTYSGDSFSQEIRIAASLSDTVDYTVGLFYHEQDNTQGDEPFGFFGNDFLTVTSFLPPIFPVPIPLIAQPGDSLRYDHALSTETLALFGQATWQLSESWQLKAGARWTEEDKDADILSETSSSAPLFQAAGIALFNSLSTPIDASFERSSDNVDWLLSLTHDLSDNAMVFASVTTGTKSGGFNTVSGGPEAREFDDEETMNYELGFKSTLWDSKLRLNATLFYTEIENYQSQQQLPSGVGTFISNFGEVESSGLDLYVEMLPVPNLNITAGLLYMNDYEVTSGPDTGLDLPFTADVSGSLSGTYQIPVADGALFLRADYSYIGDHSTNAASAIQLRDSDFDDRNVVNLSLGWRNDQWDLSIWGKNVTDDEYASITTTPFPFTGASAFFLAPPRTYGATLRYTF